MAATVTDVKQSHSVCFKGEGTVSRALLSFTKCISMDDSASCNTPFDPRTLSYYGKATAGVSVLKDKELTAYLHPESHKICCQTIETWVVPNWKENAATLEVSIKKKNLF
ncbi:hypothetical protein V6N13_138496 [Hibiscus sabdariffa]|uniref:Uncharacterized protein n=1 Tax=Hibiscus sabdariffa TaxID=183260 RepID=A0ABR2PJ00_9ROSI